MQCLHIWRLPGSRTAQSRSYNDMSVFQLISAPKLFHNRGGTTHNEGADRNFFPGTGTELQVTCTQNVFCFTFKHGPKLYNSVCRLCRIEWKQSVCSHSFICLYISSSRWTTESAQPFTNVSFTQATYGVAGRKNITHEFLIIVLIHERIYIHNSPNIYIYL